MQHKRTKFLNHNKMKFIPLERSFLPKHLQLEHYAKNHKIRTFLYAAVGFSVLYWDWGTCEYLLNLKYRGFSPIGPYSSLFEPICVNFTN